MCFITICSWIGRIGNQESYGWPCCNRNNDRYGLVDIYVYVFEEIEHVINNFKLLYTGLVADHMIHCELGHYLSFYPWPIRAVRYCRALRHLYVCLSVCPSVYLSHSGYYSTANNIQQTLFIFGTAIDLIGSINPVDHKISMYIAQDPVELWNVLNTLSEFLSGLGPPGISILWMVFL